MKLNNLVIENEVNSLRYQEISNIYNLMLVKYKGEFDKKRALYISNVLYMNGIRDYMFFDEKLDIDEIVFYIDNRSNIMMMPQKKCYSFEIEENIGNSKESKIIDFYKKRSKIRR